MMLNEIQDAWHQRHLDCLFNNLIFIIGILWKEFSDHRKASYAESFHMTWR